MCENTLYSVKNGNFSAEKMRGEFRTKIRTETRIRGKVPSNFTFFPKEADVKICVLLSPSDHQPTISQFLLALVLLPYTVLLQVAIAGLETALERPELRAEVPLSACYLLEVLLLRCPAFALHLFLLRFFVFYCVLWLCFCQRLAKGKLCFAFCLGAKSWQFDPKFQKDFKGFQLKRCLFKCLNFASKKLEEFKV